MPDMNDDILSFVKRWNSMYPIDYWWRQKHKVPFNGKEHREQSLLDMRIEYEEDYLYARHRDDLLSEDKEDKEIPYVPGHGIIFSKRKEIQISEKEATSMFDNIDVYDLEEGDGGKITING